MANESPKNRLTQNFVPQQRLASVLHFLREKPDQVSGFPKNVDNAYELFVDRLREKMPHVLDEALQKLEKMSKGPKGRWEELTKPQETEQGGGDGGGFTFGFGSDNEDDDEVP